MKTFTTLWLDTPKWVRGFFLGNIAYIVLVGFGFNLVPDTFPLYWTFTFFSRLIMKVPQGSHFVLFHVAWCALGALLVRWFGEKKGVIILILLMCGIGIAFFILYEWHD
jgi:hypothetical protein